MLPDERGPGSPITGRSARASGRGENLSCGLARAAGACRLAGSGPAQDRDRLRCAPKDAPLSLAERRGRIATAVDRRLETDGGIGNAKCADRARRALQAVCTSAGNTHAGQDAGSTDRPAEHASTSRSRPASPSVMRLRCSISIGPSSGDERRRWHPVNPFQMKRHGDNQRFSPPNRSSSEVRLTNHGNG